MQRRFITEDRCTYEKEMRRKVLDKVLKNSDLKLHLSDLSADMHVSKNYLCKLLKGSEFFCISEDRSIVSLNVELKICHPYVMPNGCNQEGCTLLHICPKFIDDNCTEKTCEEGHDFKTEHNIRVLKKYDLLDANIEALKKLTISSFDVGKVPDICGSYNVNKCNTGKQCDKIHICIGYIMGTCCDELKCSMNHDLLEPENCKKLLENAGVALERTPKDLRNHLKRAWQADRQLQAVIDMKAKDKEERERKRKKAEEAKKKVYHANEDDGNVEVPEVCIFLLNGRCYDGEKGRCKRLHAANSFHWQVQHPKSLKWVNLSKSQSQNLENLYVDPNIDKSTLKDFAPDEIHLTNRVQLQNLFKNQECKADFGKMTLLDVKANVSMNMRRLCTESSVMTGGKQFATKWLWYFKDRSDIWMEYGSATPEHSSQSSVNSHEIEGAFCTSQGKGTLPFSTAEYSYEIDFQRMVQKNKDPRYGTEREVKRRPAPLTSGTSEVSPASYRHTPKHWDSMQNTNCKMVNLSPSSPEYKNVVGLLRSTGKDMEFVITWMRTFPNCELGNQCTFVHPKCCFDAACTQPDCVFSHSVPLLPLDDSLTATTDFPWQFQHPELHKWIYFTESQSLYLEKHYADPNIDRLTLKDFGVPGNGDARNCMGILHSFRDSEWEVEFIMMMLYSVQSNLQMKIRRIGTKSAVMNGRRMLTSVWLWYFKDQTGAWVEYGSSTGGVLSSSGRVLSSCKIQSNVASQDIERAYLASQGKGTLLFHTDHHPYELDFQRMVQKNTNIKYGTEREVKRRPAPPTSSILSEVPLEGFRYTPKHWLPMHDPSSKFRLVTLSPTSQEHMDVASLFQEAGVGIQKVIRVQNPYLWEVYQSKKLILLSTDFKNDPSMLNEKFLFHGTIATNIPAICEQNFDWRLHGTSHASLYGQGVYFATDPKLSMKYARGGSCMFVAKGNGHEHDFTSDQNVFIMDMYNPDIYPGDHVAERGISCPVRVKSGTQDEAYLEALDRYLDESLNMFTPDLVVYNAGTDSYAEDPEGCLLISKQGLIRRDELVFGKVRGHGIPIAMVLSGGSLRRSPLQETKISPMSSTHPFHMLRKWSFPYIFSIGALIFGLQITEEPSFNQ
ncbi:unnamed protein product [Darwinula stevensoni]|uniref:Poly [ADP-ribose] polymerase n=1 Tax=Darwinula stevensoni TaxID=69355 RepID=A0A7R8XC80_9CRUS|nr:unnamed protein product [Darwinula stevensoni]CAG0887443.1 unnamed protein product [Darwinula stevensoni]